MILPPPVSAPAPSGEPAIPRPVTYKRHPLRDETSRTAGRLPIYNNPAPARQVVQSRLSAADQPKPPIPHAPSALALREDPTAAQSDPSGQENNEDFGFFDLLDVVNPLQHLPVVGFVYRKVTGDTIKPVAQIAGGGLYGGLPGAAASLVNVAVEEATGRDIAETVFALVDGDPESQADTSRSGNNEDTPESRLSRVARAYSDLPGTTLGVAQMGYYPSSRSPAQG